MILEIQHLTNQYIDWLRDKTQLHEMGDHVEITTPFLDRHNDYLQIYVKQEKDGYLLTDDGYIIEDLSLSGCDLITKKKQMFLEMTLNGFGVKKVDSALVVTAKKHDFSSKKHSLIQSMIAVNDMFYMASPIVTSLFIEDVSIWLDQSDIRYTPRVKFTGKSGYDHMFEFVVPKSKTAPERILKAINKPNKDSVEAFVFSWIDTKDVRATDTRAIAILNDSENVPSTEVLSALKSYDIHPLRWSEKDEGLDLLRA